MHILDNIVAHKKKEVAQNKEITSVSELEKGILFERTVISISDRLNDENNIGIISEFKRRSPSKPTINLNAKPEDIAPGYVEAGASAISVLTDEYFFGGTADDLKTIRQLCQVPILRKDFMIDEYQILEAKAMGADVILLIAEILTKKEVVQLAKFARNIGLEVLLEIHSEQQLDKYTEHVNVLGVNNRNLDTFQVDFNNSIELFNKLPKEATKISESGIHYIDTIKTLREVGYDGFLIGERFMKTDNPAEACREFISMIG